MSLCVTRERSDRLPEIVPPHGACGQLSAASPHHIARLGCILQCRRVWPCWGKNHVARQFSHRSRVVVRRWGRVANDRLCTGPLRPLRWHLPPMTQLLCNIVSDLRRGFGIWAVGCCLLAKLPPLAHRSRLRCVLKMFWGEALVHVHLSCPLVSQVCSIFSIYRSCDRDRAIGRQTLAHFRSVMSSTLTLNLCMVVRLQFVVPKASRDGLVAC